MINQEKNGKRHEHTLTATKSLTKPFEEKRHLSYLTYLILIFLFAIILRAGMLDHALFNDEIHPGRIIDSQDALKIFFSHDSGHPPFTTWAYWFFSLFLGNNTSTFRIASLVFSMISILLIYLLAKKEFGKQTALIAAFFMSISAWFVIGSTQVHLDAPFLMFFYIAIIYTTLLYDEQKKSSLLILLGLLFFFALLTKETSVLIIPIAFCFLFCKNKPFSIKTYTTPAIAFFIGGLLFFAFLLFATVYTNGTDIKTTNIYQLIDVYLLGKTTQAQIDWRLYIFPYILAIIFATPLVFALVGIALKQWKPAYKPYLIWILLIVLFYALSIKSASASFERWYITALPAIAIIGANALLTYEWKKKDIALLCIVSIGFLILLLMLNTTSSENLSFHPKTTYTDALMHGKINILLPFLGNAGPIGFYVSLPSILLGFGIAGALLIFLFFSQREKITHLIIIFLLATSFAFNVLIIEEASYGLLHGNVNAVTKDLITAGQKNMLQEPLFIFRNYAFNGYYLSQTYTDLRILDFPVQEDAAKIDEIKKTHGTVLIVDFPLIEKNSSFWKMLMTECEKKREIQDKEVTGYLFLCEENNNSRTSLGEISSKQT